MDRRADALVSRRRSTAEEEAARRVQRRQEAAERHASAWLVGALPDDPELRAYVMHLGHLYVVQRQIHRFTREADAAWRAFWEARVALEAAAEGLRSWTALLEEHALAADRARDAWRRAEWDASHPRDDDAHVWDWYRHAYERSPRR